MGSSADYSKVGEMYVKTTPTNEGISSLSQRLAELQACGLRLGRVLGVADGKMEALRGLCAAASLK